MKTKWMKLIIFYLIALTISLFIPSFAANTPTLNTTLTDSFNGDKPSTAKTAFPPDTPMIYLVWESTELKENQILKAIWIAEDTHGVVAPNFVIDQATLTLTKDAKQKILSYLPGGYWDGKFSMSKPTKGWPLGKYRIDVYLDNQLIKSVNFVIANMPVNEGPTSSSQSWGAISIDIAENDPDPYYGKGGGDTKEEAAQNAQKFCTEAGGAQCKVMVDYQQCGAYAAGKESAGAGKGPTGKIASANAMKECNANDCAIIVYDCN